MYFVYYLQSKIEPSRFYTGYTINLDKRIKQHNLGLSPSTKPYLPWNLIFYEAYTDRKDAKRREKYLKTTKGRKGLKLMLRFSITK
jgi:putative endonuclease